MPILISEQLFKSGANVQVARYFFDILDGERRVRDEVGLDLADEKVIAQTTFDLLLKLARDELNPNKSQHWMAIVRNETGHVIYRGSMRLEIERCYLPIIQGIKLSSEF